MDRPGGSGGHDRVAYGALPCGLGFGKQTLQSLSPTGSVEAPGGEVSARETAEQGDWQTRDRSASVGHSTLRPAQSAVRRPDRGMTVRCGV